MRLFFIRSLMAVIIAGCSFAGAPAWAATLSGTVLGPGGAPVAGALVGVTSTVDAKPSQQETKTDEAGRFDVEVASLPAAGGGKGRRAGNDDSRATVTVASPGLAVVSAELKGGENVIRLERAVAISGLVQDEVGRRWRRRGAVARRRSFE